MRIDEIYAILDEISPKRLSDEYCARFGAYDNSGILLNVGKDVTGILFTLDLTESAIEKAVAQGANLIVTHHPVIYGKISDVCIDDPTLLGKKIVRCLQAGISVVSMHLNLDVAPDGIDENLRDGILLSAKTVGAGMRLPKKDEQIMHVFEGGGYGRVYNLPAVSFGAFCEEIGKTFSTDRLVVYGEKNREITRIASFCGAGADEESILFAKQKGAQAIVSSDFKHHLILLARELDLAVVEMTHFASENYGFKKYYEKIRQRVTLPCVFHTETELL